MLSKIYYYLLFAIALLVKDSFLLAGGCLADNVILNSLKLLTEQDYVVRAWSINNNNSITLQLASWNDEADRADNYYTELDSSGAMKYALIRMSESPQYPNWDAAVFDRNGKYFEYGGDTESPFSFFFFDPLTEKAANVVYQSPEVRIIFGAVNISPNMNMIYAGGARKSGAPGLLLKHDLLTNNIERYVINLTDGCNMPKGNALIYPLDSEKYLLVSGISMRKEGVDGRIQGITKTIYDLDTGKLSNCEYYSFPELGEAGALYMNCPGPSQIFKKNGCLFYIALGKGQQGVYQSYIVEIDQSGNMIFGENMTVLSLDYSTLSALPDEFLLFQNREKGYREYWLMSLDNFPNMIIDKGR